MLKTTKLGICIVIGGSLFDLATSIINLSTGHFYELNPFYHLFGALNFSVLYIILTAGIAMFMASYDHYYAISHYRLTILTVVTISLYGVFHMWLGYHNLAIFLA